MSGRTADRLAIGALLLFPLLLLGRACAPGRILLPRHPARFAPLDAHADPAFLAEVSREENPVMIDRVLPILTDARAFVRGVREGRVPLWDAHDHGGAPLLGQAIAGSLYPPNLLLHLVLGPERAFAPLAILTLFLGGAFAYRFFRARALSPAASMLGAIAFAFSGHCLANLHYSCKVDALVWLPAALLAVERLAKGGGALAAAGLAASLGLSLLAGFPQVSAYVVAAAGLYAACRLGGSGDGSARRSRLLLAGAGLLAGIALGGVQLFPAVEASRQSLRSFQTLAEFRSAALEAPVLSHLLLPHAFGSATEAPAGPLEPFAWLFLGRPTQFNFTESALYAGLPALLLAGAAFLRRGSLFPSLGLAFSLLFAFGSPLLAPLFQLPLARVGVPARMFALGAFFAAWLAAIGAERILGSEGRRERRAAGISALLLSGLAVAGALTVRPGGLESRSVPRLLERWMGSPEARNLEPLDEAKVRSVFPSEVFEQAGRRLRGDLSRLALLAALAGGLLVLRPRPILLGALLLGDLASFGRSLLAPRSEGVLFPECPPVAGTRAAAGDGRAVRFDPTPGPKPGEAFNLLRPNLLAEYGVDDLSGYMAFPPRRPVELFEALDPRTRWGVWLARIPEERLLGHPLLDLAGVGAILSARAIDRAGLEEVHAEPGFLAYRRKDALPRAWVVPRARRVRDDGRPGPGNEAIAAIARGDVSPRDEVLLPEGAPGSGSGTGGGEVRWRRPIPERIEIDVRGSGGGWLVTSEVFYPGWEASLEGRAVPMARANYAWSAVPIPAGDSRVVLSYRPASFSLGCAATAAGALFLLACLAVRRGRAASRKGRLAAP